MTESSSQAERTGATSRDKLLAEFGARCHFLMRGIEWGDLRIEEILITREKAWLVAIVDTPCAIKHQPVLYFKGPKHLEPLASDLRINADLVENYGLPLLRRHMILEDLAAI